VNELLQNACYFPQTLNWYVAPSYRQAKRIAWKMLNQITPDDLIIKRYEVELRIVLINGSEIALIGADNEEALRGVGVSFVVLDEFGLMKQNVWQEIIRPMLTDTRGRALFIGTPKGKNQLWELWLKGQKGEDGFKSWRFKTSDNPFIDPQEIREARQQLNDRYFRQEYEASFEDFVGLIYPVFCNEHIVEPFNLPADWDRVVVLDHGTTRPTAVLWAASDYEGTIYVYDEHYEAGHPVSYHAERIKQRDNSSVRDWLIDPSCLARVNPKGGQLYSIVDEYREHGLYFRPADNNLLAGINRVTEYFKSKKLFIFKTCRNLIWELERYHWSEERETSTGLLQPKPFKKDDHLCDCLRYLCLSRPQQSQRKEPVPEKYSPAWFIEQDEIEAQNWRKIYASVKQ